MVSFPTLMTLVGKGAAGLDEIVLPAIATRALERLHRARRGVVPSAGTPTFISGPLSGAKHGDAGILGRIGGRRCGGVENEVIHPGADFRSEERRVGKEC